MAKSEGFESLEAWIAARQLRKEVSAVAKTFPPHEKFKLVDQVVNSARSVHANIAEDYGRFHYKETTKHCRIARGSLTETFDHLIAAFDENYITAEQLGDFRAKYNRCHKLISGYIGYINRLNGKPPEKDYPSE